MKTLELNDLGISFFEKTKRKIKMGYYVFPALCVFVFSAGYVKLGLSLYSLIVTFFLTPVLFLYFYKSTLEPKKLLNNLVIKIEINNEKVSYYTRNEVFSGSFKRNISKVIYIHESTFRNIYTLIIGADEFYIIPEFFSEIDELDCFLAEKK